MQIELTKEDIQAVIGMLDVAVKAGGLQVAQHAIPIAVKLQGAMDAQPAAEQPSD
jgi:hypothetical protein